MAAYPFKQIEAKWQAHWESQATFRVPDDVDTSKPKYYVLDMFPYPSGDGPARRPSRGLHGDRHRRALQAHARLQRAASDGLGRVRPARRAVRDQDRHASARSRRSATSATSAAAEGARLLVRLGARGQHDRPRATTSGRSGSSCSCSSAASRIRPSCRSTGAPRSAPCSRTRRSSTASPRSAASRRAPAAAPVDAADHRVRRRAARGPRRPRLARAARRRCSATGSAAAKAPRSTSPVDGHAGTKLRVFTTRPDTLFGATYMVLAPEHPLVDDAHDARRSAPPSTRIATQASRKSELERTELQKDKTGVFTGAYAMNPATGGKIPDLDRRLRARGLRHRRDHGRAGARRARLRVRAEVRPARDSHGAAAGRLRRRERVHRRRHRRSTAAS